jgi:5,10-methylenetetrahydrofolate reductase
MARFSELYTRTSKPVLSVEVFPPKTPKGWANLYYELYHLTRHKPGFVSVTYGAGGSTRKQTLELMYEIRTRFRVESVPHFTCVGATKESVREYLDRALALGAQNIVALRGDPPGARRPSSRPPAVSDMLTNWCVLSESTPIRWTSPWQGIQKATWRHPILRPVSSI